MCYLQIKCLKPLIAAGSFISVLLGLAALVAAIVFLAESSGLWAPSQQGYRDWLVGLTGGCGLVSMAAGVLGVMGAKSKTFWMLRVYTVVTIVMFLVFIGMSVSAFVIPKTIMRPDCLSTEQSSWVREVREVSEMANSTFCRRINYCYVTRNFNATQLVYLKDIGFNPTKTDLTAPVQVQKQKDWPVQENITAITIFLQSVELFFKCSGWCTAAPYFMFSNVNNIPDTWGGCHSELKGFLLTRGQVLGGTMLVIALLLGVNVLLICCLLNHPSNRFEKSYYQRFVAEVRD